MPYLHCICVSSSHDDVTVYGRASDDYFTVYV